MSKIEIYDEKFSRIARQTRFGLLPADQREFLRRRACDYRFSQEELRQLSDIGVDLSGEDPESTRAIGPADGIGRGPSGQKPKRVTGVIGPETAWIR